MQCPKCGNEKLTTYKSAHVGSFVQRIRKCENTPETKGCGLTFRTVESIDTVEVFNPQTISSELVSLKEYVANHREKELNGMSGFQRRMFE